MHVTRPHGNPEVALATYTHFRALIINILTVIFYNWRLVKRKCLFVCWTAKQSQYAYDSGHSSTLSKGLPTVPIPIFRNPEMVWSLDTNPGSHWNSFGFWSWECFYQCTNEPLSYAHTTYTQQSVPAVLHDDLIRRFCGLHFWEQKYVYHIMEPKGVHIRKIRVGQSSTEVLRLTYYPQQTCWSSVLHRTLLTVYSSYYLHCTRVSTQWSVTTYYWTR